MYGTMRCELCGGVAAVGEGARVAGTDLCPQCSVGDFGLRLAGRGIRLQWTCEEWHRDEGGRGGGGGLEVRGAIPFDLGLHALFSREDFFSKVGKLFGKELQVGDAAFDAAIYIRTSEPEALGDALRDELLRAAIQGLVASTKATVSIEEGTVALEDFTIEPEARRTALRDIALVLHRLERRASALRLPPRPELATYPDLREKVEYVGRGRRALEAGQYMLFGLRIEDATLDHLGPVVAVHDPAAATSKALEELRLARVHILAHGIEPLSRLSSLRVIELESVPAAERLPSLAAPPRLEELTVRSCPLTDVSSLAGATALRELKLNDLPLSDVRPLAGARGLCKLDLRGTAVTDLSALTQLPGLALLWIQGLDVPAQQVDALRRARPALELDPY